jgi:hypothetical protein
MRVHTQRRKMRTHARKRTIQRGRGLKHNKTAKLAKVNCSPKPKGEINQFSCYTNKSLYKLRDLWNARHPDAKITSTSPKEIHHQIAQYLSGVCNKESCWIRQRAVFGPVESDMADSFAPESPTEWKKNPNEFYWPEPD